jgi:hypothetical protein
VAKTPHRPGNHEGGLLYHPGPPCGCVGLARRRRSGGAGSRVPEAGLPPPICSATCKVVERRKQRGRNTHTTWPLAPTPAARAGSGFCWGCGVSKNLPSSRDTRVTRETRVSSWHGPPHPRHARALACPAYSVQKCVLSTPSRAPSCFPPQRAALSRQEQTSRTAIHIAYESLRTADVPLSPAHVK